MTTVSGLWIGERLSALERACVGSFIKRGHRFVLYVYDAIDNVPPGCEMADASHIVPRERIFAHARGVAQGSWATFSDLFRYELLYRQGGWWVDLDVFCLAPQLPAAQIAIGRQDSQLINGAVLRFPPHHAAMAAAKHTVEVRGNDVGWAEIGPKLLTELCTNGTIEVEPLPETAFYPIHFSQFWNLYDPRRLADAVRRLQGAYCLHLWNEMIRRAAIDKNALPPKGSVMRNLYENVLDIAEFTHEYVLRQDSPVEKLEMSLIERRG